MSILTLVSPVSVPVHGAEAELGLAVLAVGGGHLRVVTRLARVAVLLEPLLALLLGQHPARVHARRHAFLQHE